MSIINNPQPNPKNSLKYQISLTKSQSKQITIIIQNTPGKNINNNNNNK